MKRASVAVAALFLWAGFVGAISFMEAWLKFRAPGITLPLGLGIGRLVFAALNKMEWLFLLLAVVGAWPLRPADKILKALFPVLALILVLQTAWMLPALDVRAQQVILRQPTPPSSLHLYYILTEAVKLVLLMASGMLLLQRRDFHRAA